MASSTAKADGCSRWQGKGKFQESSIGRAEQSVRHIHGGHSELRVIQQELFHSKRTAFAIFCDAPAEQNPALVCGCKVASLTLPLCKCSQHDPQHLHS